MPTQITNYQCPACTGPLHFKGSTGELECEYCGSTYEVAEIEALYAEKLKAAEEAGARENEKRAARAAEAEKNGAEPGYDEAVAGWGEDGEKMRAYSCPSCGAELICDETTAATSCPYCGNPTVVPGQFSGGLRPDCVIPFKLDKEAAVAALGRYYRGKKLLPKSFSEKNHIDEIKGVYVPFWLFDGEADADVSYDASTVRSYTSGKERVTVTEHYNVRRAGSVAFERIPVDASTKMPDEHMDAIEPFDYSELKPFSTAYMPGFLADKYDVSAQESSARADERASNTALDVMEATVQGYTSCIPVSKDVRLKKGGAKYALLPVWLLSTRWNGKNFLFAMNGQTGRLIGDLPISKGKFFAWFAGIAVPLMAVMALLLRSM